MTELPAPHPDLRACVVVPARDEEELIGACLTALGDQRTPGGKATGSTSSGGYEVLIVLDGCVDATAARVLAFMTEHPELAVHVLERDGGGVGLARRQGMDAACERLHAVGRPDGLIASTDADSVVAQDWLERQLAAVARGARAIGGRIELMPDTGLAPEVLASRRAQGQTRHQNLLAGLDQSACARAEHWQFSGASMALTAATYAELGGLEPRAALEDEALERVLGARGIAIERPLDVRVSTSARTRGRAPRGLAHDLALGSWLAGRHHHAGDFPAERVLDLKDRSVSVIVPTREVAATVGGVLSVLDHLVGLGVIDEVLVVDAGSRDQTAQIAASHHARLVAEDELMPEFGVGRGKGDAMWRGLSATDGDLVVYVDADTADFGAGFVCGLLGPLLQDPSIELVKGSFARPFRVGQEVLPHGGGRVTELVARPLLNLHRPALAGFEQPLAGEIAARRSLLETLAFPVGYGVEIAMLLDAEASVGVGALAQVDLGSRQNRHQPLHDLSAMAYAVMVAASRRLLGEGAVEALAPGALARPRGASLEMVSVPVEERPALAGVGTRGLETPEIRAMMR